MTATTNTENLRQYKSGFSLVVEQILALVTSTDSVREDKNLSLNFKRLA